MPTTPPAAALAPLTEISLPARLRQLAAEHPDAPAVTCGEITLSRTELLTAAERLARHLKAGGVGLGDYVSLVLPNSVEILVAVVATWLVGAVPQPLMPWIPANELAQIIALATPKAVIGEVDAALPAGTVRVPGDLSGDDGADLPLPDVVSPAWKAPTSGGSTGRPKIIVAGQPALHERVVPFADLLLITPGSTVLVTAPVSHNGPLITATLTLLVGGHAVLMPRFDAEQVLRLIEAHRVSWVYSVPTMMGRVWKLPPETRTGFDLSSVVVWMHMAAPCPPALKAHFLDWLGAERVFELYGGSEVQALCLVSGTEWLDHRGSVGRVLLGEMEIRDDAGRPAPTGTVGRVWMRRGEDAEPTYHYIGAEPVTDGAGWECLGDLGRFDADGYLYLADRETDMILVGGVNVYPAEVEAALLEHPAVSDACVIGLPSEDLGCVPHALVRAPARVPEEELRAFLASRLAPYKQPRSYEYVDEALRDDAGKVRRSALRAARLADPDATG